MSSAALETLLYAMGDVELDLSVGDSIFLNAQFHQGIVGVKAEQSFHPFSKVLIQAAIDTSHEIDVKENSLDTALVLVPKNMVEARCLIARALLALRVGGVLLCSAENKAGGTRLQKVVAAFGVDDLRSFSKNKSRAIYAIKENISEKAIHTAIEDGAVQAVLNDRFTSQPGIFGWNKIDKGSEILTRYIPQGVKGRGADFGCGYGFLSDHVLKTSSKVKHLHCIDADYRAVTCAEKNLQKYECDKTFLWRDLTQVQSDLKNLDFIVMNPPFHEGKMTDMSIGRKFIETAYQALRRGGRLWVVANAHLPYERLLEDQFFECTKHHEGGGFKVYEALK